MSHELTRVPVRGIERVARRGENFTPLPSHDAWPEFGVGERAEQAWGLYNEYVKLNRGPKVEIADVETIDPLAQRLEGELARLWADPAVARTIELKLTESIAEKQPHSETLITYKKFKAELDQLDKEYFDLLRNQFLMRQMTPTLRGMDLARVKSQRATLGHQLQQIEQDGGASSSEKQKRGGGIAPEHADLSALVAYDRIRGYHTQFRDSGIIMTPTRKALLGDVVEQTSGGTWMLLSGETGSGKTTFARETSHVLNGEPPLYANGEKWGDAKALIGSKSVDPTTGQVYYEFGPVVAALTGCTNSLEMEEAIRTGQEKDGRLALLDELNKFDQDALFGVLKIASTLRGGEEFGYKEMPGVKLKMAKKGFALMATMNPATVRYDRKELDPAIERLFYGGKKTVNYLTMSAENPELYEAFLGVLMDDNGRIRISEEELGPAYETVTEDASGLRRQQLVSAPQSHGALYRFALASGEIHKSYSQIKNVGETATDPGFLEKTVLDMEVLVDWIRDYRSEVEGGLSLNGYLGKKLHDFYENIDIQEDKAIFKRIFGHYGFGIDSIPVHDKKPDYKPLTPLEMGCLTPRTKRATTIVGEELVPKSIIMVLPDGTDVEYVPQALGWVHGTLEPNAHVTREGKLYKFLGLNPHTEEEIYIEADSIPTAPSATESTPKSDAMVERARDLLGKDFLGVEAVITMQDKLRQNNVNVTFDIDSIPPADWNETDLQFAKDNDAMLVLGVESMNHDGRQGSVNLAEFQELFKDGDPEGKLSNVFYYFDASSTKWYGAEPFAAGEPLKLSWRFVKKDVLQGSTNKTWADQTKMLKEFEKKLKKAPTSRNAVRRRTAVEAAYDLALYHMNNGEQLLSSNTADWTESKSKNGHRVYVWFNADGVSVRSWHPTDRGPRIGVCPSW